MTAASPWMDCRRHSANGRDPLDLLGSERLQHGSGVMIGQRWTRRSCDSGGSQERARFIVVDQR